MDSQTAASLEGCLAKLDKRCRFHLPVPKHLRPKDGSSPVDAYVQPLPTPNGTTTGADVTLKQSSATVSITSSTSDAATKEAVERQVSASIAQQSPALKVWTDRIAKAQSNSEAAQETIDQLMGKVQVLLNVTESVKQQSDLLSSNASSLIVKKTKLEAMHTAISDVLRQFQQVDELSKEVLHPMLSPYSSRFAAMLEEMSELMTYLSSNRHFKSTKAYASKLSVAQHRAMMCLRDVLSTLFATMANDLSDSIQDGYEITQVTKHTIHQNQLFFEKFDASHTAALRILESKCGSIESDIYLQDTLAAYRDSRVRLLTPILMRHVEDVQLTAENNIKTVTVDSLTYLCDVVEEEVKLFNKIWLREDLDATLKSIVEELSDVLYGQFRASLLGVDTLDDLRRIIGYLRKSTGATTTSSMAAHGHGRSGGTTALLSSSSNVDASPTTSSAAQLVLPIAQKMISDTQERVVFRTSIYMRSAIQLYRWNGSVAQFLAHAAPSQETQEASAAGEAAPAAEGQDVTPSSTLPGSIVPSVDVVDRCIYLLDLLHNTVSPSVFAVFAEEAVHWTVQHVHKIESQIAALPKPELLTSLALALEVPTAEIVLRTRKNVSVAMGRLFSVHHLLNLRERLAPYETQLMTTDKDLDFGQLMQRKLQIVQSTREAKKDIEAELKHACESIIVEFQGWLPDRAEAVKTVSGENAAEVYRTLHTESLSRLLEVEKVITPYIAAPTTRAVLLKPVRGQAMESLDQMATACAEAAPGFVRPVDLPPL